MARQSLIVRGLFPMLADPRHPVLGSGGVPPVNQDKQQLRWFQKFWPMGVFAADDGFLNHLDYTLTKFHAEKKENKRLKSTGEQPGNIVADQATELPIKPYDPKILRQVKIEQGSKK